MARKLKKSEEVNVETTKVDEDAAPVIAEEGVEKASEPEVEASLAAEISDEALYHAQCGGALRAKRIEQDLTTQAIAKQLRLSHKQIEALEENNFAALPEPTIVKGFIRNYAKLLKMPAEPILAAYAQLKPNTEQYAFALNPSINMKITESSKSSSSRYLILSVLLLLGLGAWFFYQNFIQKPDAMNPMPEMTELVPEALPLPAEAELPQADVLNKEESVVVVDEGVIDGEEAADLSRSEDTVVAEELAAEETAQAEPELTVAPAAANETRLEFNATQETWISVVNTSGKEVYNKILYAGNRDTVNVVAPSQVVVGNAHGATLVVDGKPINLAPYTRINVARVRLGR